jgi:hypothetical protein
MTNKTEYFDCSCHLPEHAVRFMLQPGYLPDEKDKFGMTPEFYAEVQLNNFLPWYRRLLPAVKYMFGRQASCGHWDCWLLKPEDTDRLHNLIVEYKDQYATWEKAQASEQNR